MIVWMRHFMLLAEAQAIGPPRCADRAGGDLPGRESLAAGRGPADAGKEDSINGLFHALRAGSPARSLALPFRGALRCRKACFSSSRSAGFKSPVAPFGYTQPPWAVVFGIPAFGDPPDFVTLTGRTTVVAGHPLSRANGS
jgi:hypothetical protein